MGEGRGAHRVLVGRLEGKRPLGRPRRRWEDNIKMDLQEVGGPRSLKRTCGGIGGGGGDLFYPCEHDGIPTCIAVNGLSCQKA
jgi:hypothetical protein